MAAKKENKFKKISNYIKFICLVIVFGTLFVPFAPAITLTVDSVSGSIQNHYGTGFNFMFTNVIHGQIKYTSLSIAIMPLIAYILTALAFIVLLLNTLHSKYKNKSLLSLLVFALLLVSSILMLSSHEETAKVLAGALIGKEDKYVAQTIYKNTTLAFGFFGVAIFNIVSCVLTLIKLFFDGYANSARTKVKKSKK